MGGLSQSEKTSWAGPLLGPGHLAGPSGSGPPETASKPPWKTVPPAQLDPRRPSCRTRTTCPTAPPPCPPPQLLRWKQSQLLCQLSHRPISNGRWSPVSSPNLAYSNFGLIATLGQRLWSFVLRESAREGLTHPPIPPIPTAAMCAASTLPSGFDQH